MGRDMSPSHFLHPDYMVAPNTGLKRHRGSMNTNSSASTGFLGVDFAERPKSTLSIFDSRSGVVPSSASTAPSENLICAETVREELAAYGYPEDVLSRIVPDRRKLFAILTLIGKGDLIIKLIEEGIDDGHLPFDVDPVIGSLSCQVRGDEGAHKTYEIKAFALSPGGDSCWKPRHSDLFFTYQWQLLAPHFDMLCPCDDQCSTARGPTNYRFRPEEILPFTKPSDEWEPFEQPGGFSVVRKVHIHPAHRSYCGLERCKLASLEANHAVKSIHKGYSPTDVQSEINSLKRFDGKKHRDRLVRLLCTFEYNEQTHLVFLWADGGNLQDFWQKHFPDINNPPRSYHLAKWVAGEILGITQGLHLIHHPGPSSTTDEQTEGRHGDIKPENILWFSNDGPSMGTLKISDFGLADFHRKASVSKVRADTIGQTPTYRPPECEIQGGYVSQSYDTWSLGCVLLQFVTWYVEGWEGVDEFSKRRSEASPPRKVRDQDVPGDMFYALSQPPTPNAAVENQFVRLRQHERCSDMFVDMLEFIENRLLLIDGTRRARSEELVNKFEEIYTKCCENEAYCISRTPRLALRRNLGVRGFFQTLNCCF
ncbi:kinase-like domain-containing protein [Chaetomium sp. MPI-CAGE-AT-0009]|nr:kinase-like domain-containing protein [Chaetomium sp. MPI-CAGE-AT-0009]